MRKKKLAVMSLATNRSIRPSSSRSAATTPRPRPSRSTIPACGGDVDEPAAVVAEQVVGQGGKPERQAGDVAVRSPRVAAQGRMLGVPGQVVADVEVQVAVAVEVGEGGRGRPVAVAAQAGALGHVLERAVAPVAVAGRTTRTA